MCTGTPEQKIDSSKSVPVHLHGNYGICFGIQFERKGTLVNQPRREDHVGEGYKSNKTQGEGSF